MSTINGEDNKLFLQEACKTIFEDEWEVVFEFCSKNLSFPVSKCGDAFGKIPIQDEIKMKFCGRGQAKMKLVEEVTKRHTDAKAGISLHRPPFFVTLGGPGLGKTRILKDLWDNALIPSPNNSPYHPLAASKASKSDINSPALSKSSKSIESAPNTSPGTDTSTSPLQTQDQHTRSSTPISSTPPSQASGTTIFDNSVKFFLSRLLLHYEMYDQPSRLHPVLSSSLLILFYSKGARLESFCKEFAKCEPLKKATFETMLHFVLLALGCHKWSGPISILIQFDEIQDDVQQISSGFKEQWGDKKASKCLIKILNELMANPLEIRPKDKAVFFVHMAGLTDTSLMDIIFTSAGTYIELPASLAKIESIFAAFDSFNQQLALKSVSNRSPGKGKRVYEEVAPNSVVEWEASSRMKILLTLLGGRFRSLEVLCSMLAPKNGEPFTSSYFPDPDTFRDFLNSIPVPTSDPHFS